mmetsp:Transcript_137183/g.273739  ORF Transcript_137183/g.273739 Transcript_137183/m.273739 type:complete len:1095 (+) Transcript_137183:153-3437(+)|eukprot:CAMPEP_0172674930 /NCGR_PEP_ID=MMETSP1074-20121228/13001_1 /TAXON_ID=2916 /ORGANISM="Ceratium fusus, Strain PA161109" /LENGTH=1094 /DNA_ID=CAMNT_0013492373 /DNA_START=169 /DNA_END=3453 /DNA_ORIENTATION=+
MTSVRLGIPGRAAPSPKGSPRLSTQCHGSSVIVLPTAAQVPLVPRLAALKPQLSAKSLAAPKWADMPSWKLLLDGNTAQLSSQTPGDAITQLPSREAGIQGSATSTGDAAGAGEHGMVPAEEASKCLPSQVPSAASMPSLPPWPTTPTAMPKTGLEQTPQTRCHTINENLSSLSTSLPQADAPTPPGCILDPDHMETDEVSEDEMRRALRALTFFFSESQLRAIVATPPSHYASVAIPDGEVEKQPSSVTRSLRVALRLLGLTCETGKKFRKVLSSEEFHQEQRPRLRRHTHSSSPLQQAAHRLVPKLQLPPRSPRHSEVPMDYRQPQQTLWTSPVQRCMQDGVRQANNFPGSRGDACNTGSSTALSDIPTGCPKVGFLQEREAEDVAQHTHDGDLKLPINKSTNSGATESSLEGITSSCSASAQRALAKAKGLPSSTPAAATPKAQYRGLSPKSRISPSSPKGKNPFVSPMQARCGGQLQRMQQLQSRCSPSRRAAVQEAARHSITRRTSPLRWSGAVVAVDASQQQQADTAETALPSFVAAGADTALAQAKQRLHAFGAVQRTACHRQESPRPSITLCQDSPRTSIVASPMGVGAVSHDQQRALCRSEGSRQLPNFDGSPDGCETRSVSKARVPGGAVEDRRSAGSPPRLLGSRSLAKCFKDSSNKHNLQAQSRVPSPEGVSSPRTSPQPGMRDANGRQPSSLDPRRREREAASPPRLRGKALGLEHYAVGKMLGRGAFGKVNVGVHKLTEELTAMKLCERKRIADSQAKKCLMQEVNILRRVNGHANIIQLLEVIETDTTLVLVMEFAACGDLLRYVRQHRKLAEDCAQGLFKQLLDGLDHIHRIHVVHRDIKLENLLLDSFGCLKIADFGVATLLKCPEQRLDDHCGTPSYIAPEVLLDSGYQGPPVDMWSAGIVLYAMLIGHAPFKADQLLDLRRCILRGRYHTPSHLSEEASHLLRRLLVVEPSNRATLGEVADHAWLRNVDNPAIGIYGPAGMIGKGVSCLEHFEDLLQRMDDFGFPRTYLEESLGQGRLNRATATFYLLAQQKLRRRALDAGATMITSVGSLLSAASTSLSSPRQGSEQRGVSPEN